MMPTPFTRLLILCLLVLGIVVTTSVTAKTTLPLPRFVSLKTDEANVRAGPGLRYPIKWVLVRRGMPLEVMAEFEQWRKVRDIQGDEGWVHRSQLSNKRMAIVTGSTQILREKPARDAAPVVRTEAGVQGELISCEVRYCMIGVADDGYRGWVSRDNLWGAYPGEWIN